MGAINYGSSYYMYSKGERASDKDITIGLKPSSDYSDDESGYNEYVASFEDPEEVCSRCDYDYDEDENSYELVKEFLEDCDMPNHYTVSIESGYYEGFYLKIEGDDPWCLASEEKKAYQRDITCLKKLLVSLISKFGLKVVYPGWVTGYCDEKDSLKELNEFIKNLRQEIKDVETYAHYMRCNAA